MSNNRKSGGAWKETRHDKWYLLAKEQGYRSRAAFKLIQLNKKYNLLNGAKSVLDLGAAPGGWLQVCSRYMPVSSLLLGVDLLPIKPMRGVTTIQADMTTAECRTLIKKELQGWDVDLVLCDGAPNVAGGTVWSKDAYQQNELVIHALRLATHFMRPGAQFVTKVFRSQDYNALLWVLGQLFRHVDVTKPLASRNASAEIFVVCREYLAPKRIDPFLLDPAHVFQQFENSGESKPDVFHQKTGKTERSRQGYDEAETHSTVIGKVCDVTVFVDAEQPIVALGSYGRFVWESERAKAWRAWSASTTDEVVELSRDLKVLGKGDLKALLRWRKKVRDFEKQLKKEEGMKDEEGAEGVEGKAAAVEVVKTDEEKAAEEEAEMTAAIRELKQRELQRKKTDKKRKRDMRNKLTRRLLLNKNNLTDVQEMIGADVNDELFSLASVQPMVMDVLENRAGEEAAEEESEASSGGDDESEAGSEEEEAEDVYMARLEQDLDRMYDAYQQRRKLVENLKDKADAQLKADEAEAMEADEGGVDEDEEAESDDEMYETMRKQSKGGRRVADDGPDSEEKSNPLLVKLTEKEKITAANRMERWFGRDVFGSLDDDGNAAVKEADEEVEAEPQVGSKRKRTLSDMMGREINTDSSDDSDEGEDSDDDADGRWLGNEDETDDGGEPLTRKQRAEQRSAEQAAKTKPLIGLDSLSKTREDAEAEQKKKTAREKKNAREERRLQRRLADGAGSSTAHDDGEDAHMLVDQDSAKKAKKMQKRLDKLRGVTAGEDDGGFETVAPTAATELSSDDEATATTLALAHRMLEKRARVDVLNGSYNRYSVDVAEQRHLPAWFKQEEGVHMQAQLPVTRQEVDEYRQRLMAINAKPIKKIAEARARNRVKAERRWEKIQKKISDMQSSETGTGGSTGGSASGGGEGGSVGERLKRMEKLVKKRDKRSIRGDRKYVVTRRGGGGKETKSKKGVKQSGLTVAVDRRLKKDKRGAKIAAKRGKQKQSTANKRKRKM